MKKTKSTATLNEAAASNAPEGASKKDKSLRFMNKDEINEITNVLSTPFTIEKAYIIKSTTANYKAN